MVDDCVKEVLKNALPFQTQQQFLRQIEQGKEKSLLLLPCQMRMLKCTLIKYDNKEISCYEYLIHYLQSMTCSDKEKFVCAERCNYCNQYGTQCPTL